MFFFLLHLFITLKILIAWRCFNEFNFPCYHHGDLFLRSTSSLWGEGFWSDSLCASVSQFFLLIFFCFLQQSTTFLGRFNGFCRLEVPKILIALEGSKKFQVFCFRVLFKTLKEPNRFFISLETISPLCCRHFTVKFCWLVDPNV